MDLSNDLPQRLIKSFPRWKFLFIALYAVISTAMVVLPQSPSMQIHSSLDVLGVILGLIQLALDIVLVFALLPEVNRRLKSSKELVQVLKRAGLRKQNRYIRLYRFIYPIFLYGFSIFIGMVVSGIADSLANLVTPNLDNTQVIPGVNHPSLVASFFISLLATTEEFWRWSMILLVLFVVFKVRRNRWEMSRKFRKRVFISAIMLSSAVFGYGHIDEFAVHKVQAFLMLSVAGAILALFAIITHRFWLALCMHGLYDFIALSGNLVQITPYVLFLGLFGAIVLLPLIVYLRMKIKSSLPALVTAQQRKQTVSSPV